MMEGFSPNKKTESKETQESIESRLNAEALKLIDTQGLFEDELKGMVEGADRSVKIQKLQAAIDQDSSGKVAALCAAIAFMGWEGFSHLFAQVPSGDHGGSAEALIAGVVGTFGLVAATDSLRNLSKWWETRKKQALVNEANRAGLA